MCGSTTRFAALVALAVLASAGCRLDMHTQPRYDTLDESDFFANHQSARPVIPDTVARGQLHTNELLYTGKVNGNPADYFPFEITAKDLARGRERFNIYCSPCHGREGNGQGMIVQRGLPAPPSYHIDRLQKAPAGYIFDIVTNGFGKMYSYSSRVNTEDRWRIVAYVRALQLSHSAALTDVPDSVRSELQEKVR